MKAIPLYERKAISMRRTKWLTLIIIIYACAFLFPAAADLAVYDELPLEYLWSGYEGSNNGVSLNVDPFFESDPHQGSVCTKVTYDSSKEDYAGLYILVTGNTQRGPGIGVSIPDAKYLEFYAKGAQGGEKVSFGYGMPSSKDNLNADSSNYIQMATLTDRWERIVVDLRDKSLSHINGLFRFYIKKEDNPNGCIFYLDNINYIS
jgi:hypothetical protein